MVEGESKMCCNSMRATDCPVVPAESFGSKIRSKGVRIAAMDGLHASDLCPDGESQRRSDDDDAYVMLEDVF